MYTTINQKSCLSTLAAAGLVLTSTSASAVTLASWDAWADTAGDLDSDTSTALVTTTITGNAVRDIRSDRGSNDETFGTSAGAASDTNSLRLQKPENRVLEINVANNSGATLIFDELHFDGAYTGDSVRSFDVIFVNTSTATSSISLGSGSFTASTAGTVADYDDFDIDVSSISLDDGEEGYFQITFDGATPSGSTVNSSSAIDNVELTVVPEPSSAALLGLGGLALILRRRK